MGTKANPAPNDCHAAAADDEPIFTLRAKDPAAPEAIRFWCGQRVLAGKNRFSDPKIAEALQCADAMDDWREQHPITLKLTDEHADAGEPV